VGAVLTRLRALPGWAWLALAAVALVVAYGLGYAGYVGYDSLWALIWGDDIAHGRSPAMEGVYVPTPHPLLNLLGALLSPLGFDAARAVLELLSLASMVLLAYAAFRLGRALFSWVAGVAFAAILVTRPDVVELGLYASIDVPFLALVLLAAALVAERPRRGEAPLVPLALAGLLRPEAWLLAAAYAIYALAGRRAEPDRAGTGSRRLRVVALALAAPLLWALHDVLITGDPLASLHGTRAVAERSQPGNGLGAALHAAPGFVNDVVGIAVFACGVAGWLLVTARAQHRMALPAALFALSFVPFLVYGAVGLTLYPRFLLPAAAMLALLCAAALAGAARWPRPAQLAAAVALAVSIPFTIGELAGIRNGSETRAQLESSLTDLIDRNKPALARCRAAHVPSFRLVPLLVPRLPAIPKERYYRRLFGAPERTFEITIPPRAPRTYVVDPLRRDPVESSDRRPTRGLRAEDGTGDWQLGSNC
jgi:hypothetical protein